MLIFCLSAFSTLLSIYLWLKNDVLINIKGNLSRLFHPLLFIFLTVFTIYQYYELDEIKKIENEAKTLSRDWPTVERVQFISKGERFGIILSGQAFLEKYKLRFPDTYKEFQTLIKGRLGDYKPKKDWDGKYNEYSDLEDVCGATITMIHTFEGKVETKGSKL